MAAKKKERVAVTVLTTLGRYRIENQTRYNTDDVMAIVNEIEAEAFRIKMANIDTWSGSSEEQKDEYRKTWWKERTHGAPFGGTLQLVDRMSGVSDVANREYSHEERDWVFKKRKIYVDGGDCWNYIRMCPPDKLYSNPLEALSADDTDPQAPQFMVQQFAEVLCNVAYNCPVTKVNKALRIEAERGSPRLGVNKRPAQLEKFYADATGASYNVSHGQNNLGSAGRMVDRLEKMEKQLNLTGISRIKEAIVQAEAQAKATYDMFSNYVSSIPQE